MVLSCGSNYLLQNHKKKILCPKRIMHETMLRIFYTPLFSWSTIYILSFSTLHCMSNCVAIGHLVKIQNNVVGLHFPFPPSWHFYYFLQHLYGPVHRLWHEKSYSFNRFYMAYPFMCSHPTRVIARDLKRTILQPYQLPVIKLSHLHNYNTSVFAITYSKTIKNES